MIDKLIEILDALFMIDDKPASQRRWRTIIASAVLAGIAFASWSVGLIPGLVGFALAGTVEKQSKEVSSQISALNQRVENVEKTILKGQLQAKYSQMISEQRRLDQDIFEIESKVNQLSKENIKIDNFYISRLQELKYSQQELARRLDNFTQLHPEVVE